jgi:pimeloyl-ACP methyl ester carboxylesterase
LPDGLSASSRRARPSAKAAIGPIVLLHGAGGWRDDGFAAAAGARGFGVLAPALRGFPVPSASLRRARPSAEAAIGDRKLDERILDWLRVVAEGAIAIRGVSFGAYLALHLAASPPFVPVVALAPTSEAFVRARFRGWGANVDADSFERFLAARDVHQAAARPSRPTQEVTLLRASLPQRELAEGSPLRESRDRRPGARPRRARADARLARAGARLGLKRRPAASRSRRPVSSGDEPQSDHARTYLILKPHCRSPFVGAACQCWGQATDKPVRAYPWPVPHLCSP